MESTYRLGDLKPGDKFYIDNYNMYLIIVVDLSFLGVYSDTVYALNLCNYKISCFSPELRVMFEGDNVSI